MLNQKRFLMIPGPTPVPEAALVELARHPLPHRSKEFSEIFVNCNRMLNQIAKTKKATPIIHTASGTGAMEATIANLLSPGDQVISLVNGVFSKRWGDIAERYGAVVHRIEVEPGQAVKPDQLKEAIITNPEAKLILTTFSETSTGVRSPIKEYAAIANEAGILIATDAITGLIAMPLHMDEWGLDVVVSGSQKGFMIPPGLSFQWVSERALAASKQSQCPSYYWDWALALKALESDTTAFTPNVSLICSLHETLKMMADEGIENVWARHERCMNLTRQGVRDLGLEPLTADETASAAITSVLPPEGISVANLRKELSTKWQIIVADGQRELKGKIFRIGHLGFVFERDVETALACLGKSLGSLRS